MKVFHQRSGYELIVKQWVPMEFHGIWMSTWALDCLERLWGLNVKRVDWIFYQLNKLLWTCGLWPKYLFNCKWKADYSCAAKHVKTVIAGRAQTNYEANANRRGIVKLATVLMKWLDQSILTVAISMLIAKLCIQVENHVPGRWFMRIAKMNWRICSTSVAKKGKKWSRSIIELIILRLNWNCRRRNVVHLAHCIINDAAWILNEFPVVARAAAITATRIYAISLAFMGWKLSFAPLRCSTMIFLWIYCRNFSNEV